MLSEFAVQDSLIFLKSEFNSTTSQIESTMLIAAIDVQLTDLNTSKLKAMIIELPQVMQTAQKSRSMVEH